MGWEAHRVGIVAVEKVRRKGNTSDAIICHYNDIIQHHTMAMS